MRLEEEITPRQREILVQPYILQSPLYPREEGFSEVASLFCVKYARLQIHDWFSSYKWLPRPALTFSIKAFVRGIYFPNLVKFAELCDVHDVEREYLALRITVNVKINGYRGSA
jgi:hypothetical protein